jgi:hypothetical protein
VARLPEGPRIADRIEGPEEAKRRLKVILETISGERTIEDAAREIGVGAARFHELRLEAMRGAVAALEPRAAGRPRSEVDQPDPRVAELEAEIRELTLEVKAAHVREQIALTMPHLLEEAYEAPPPAQEKKTTRPSKILDRLKKDRKRRSR